MDFEAIDRAAAFLRMAASQLRRLADTEPTIAAPLHHMASQCDAEAAELEASRKPPANSS